MSKPTWALASNMNFRDDHEKHVSKLVWRQRHRLINEIRDLRSQQDTRTSRFSPLVSLVEQLKRFEKRLGEPSKPRKLKVDDYATRDRWGDFRSASFMAIVRKTFQDMTPEFPAVDVELENIPKLFQQEAAGLSGQPLVSSC